jgi:hypothetical protein
MGNHIKFEVSDKKFVQVDDAFKSRIVIFECNEDFRIEFADGTEPFIDPDYEGGDEPSERSPITFAAKPSLNGGYQIKIKFENRNHGDGYEYTVKLLDERELDPRICPK